MSAPIEEWKEETVTDSQGDWELPPLKDLEPLLTGFKESLDQMQTMIPECDRVLLEHEDVELILLRYLLGHGQEIDTAFSAFQKNLVWRRQCTFLSLIPVPTSDSVSSSFDPPYIKDISPCKAGFLSEGVTREGRPITVALLGRVRVSELTKSVTPEQYGENIGPFLVWNMRKLNVMSRRQGKLVDGFLVLDFKGLGLQHYSFLPFMKKDAELSQMLGPEVSGVIAVVNVPSMFHMLWNSFKGMMNEHTLKKVKLFKDSGEDFLQWVVSREELPRVYGGRRLSPLDPWLKQYDPTSLMKNVFISRGSKETLEIDCHEESTTARVSVMVESKDVRIVTKGLTHDGETRVLEESVLISSGHGLIEKNFDRQAYRKISIEIDNTHSMFTSKSVYYSVQFS